MERNLVRAIPRKIKSDILVIICFLIGLIIITILSKYYIANNKSYNNLINVYSDHLINEKYDLNHDYYLVYDDIPISNSNEKISMIFIENEINDFVHGQKPRNKFEIIVPQRYKFLLNKFININIHGNLQRFRVVGTCEFGNLFYTNLETMIEIYKMKNIKIEYYHYIFIVDDYLGLNEDLDILNENNYDVSIKNSNVSYRLSNYSTLVDFLILLKCFMLMGIGICILSMFDVSE